MELALYFTSYIHDACYKKAMIKREINALSKKIRGLVNDDKWNQLETWCSSTTMIDVPGYQSQTDAEV